MLEQLRKSSGSFLIWIIFGIIIAAFVLTFGLPGDAGPGCGASDTFAVRVAGKEANTASWRFVMNGWPYATRRALPHTAENRNLALDYLVEREIFAQAAEARGFQVSDELVNKAIARGDIWIAGHWVPGRQVYFDEGGILDYEALERFSNRLGVGSVDGLIAQQRREQLAQLMRSALTTAIAVSNEEARFEFIQGNTTVTADYVKFDVARYAAAIQLDEASIARYAAAHEEELKKLWDTQKVQWEKPQPYLRARHIFIANEPSTPPADADKPPESAEPTAKSRAEAILSRLNKGEDFAELARQLSEDKRTALHGGSLGWRPADSLGWGSKLVDGIKSLEIGKISSVIASDRGFHIVRIDEKSDQPLTFEQKKLDLAASTAARFYADKLAERDAKAALAKADTTPLDQQFERSSAPPSFPGLPGGGELSEEQIREIIERMQREQPKQQGEGETGWRIVEGRNQLAQVGSDAPPAAGAAAAEESASDAAEVLPTAVGLTPPPLQTLGPITRQGDFRAVGESKELVSALFDSMEPGKVADRVFKVSQPDGWVVVQLAGRTLADLKDFEDRAPAMRESLRARKATLALGEWITAKCKEIAGAGKIEIDPEFMDATDNSSEGKAAGKDKEKAGKYNACTHLGVGSVALQQATQQTAPGAF